METKVCNKCKIEKNISEFSKNKTRKDGMNYMCKECYKEYNITNREKILIRKKKYYEKNKNIINKKKKKIQRKQHLAYKYNITEEEYQQMNDSQNGKCAICGKTNGTRFLYVDHNHKTGKIRGLLCQKCNSILGFFDDNIKILKKAIQYLEENES